MAAAFCTSFRVPKTMTSKFRDSRLTTMSSPSPEKNLAKRQRRTENVPGPFWVDTKCIDCDTCRWMAPATFVASGGKSAVAAQPTARAERHAALQALLACPTFSIHADMEDMGPGELASARDSFPLLIPGTASVYHIGFHSERSFGAAPYLILRPQGNIMVDVPRWSPQLAERLRALGGVAFMFLSHRDDVAGHENWAESMGAKRIIHSMEVNTRQGTDAVEWQLTGEGPWHIDDDCELIFTPGHTSGCVSLLFKPDRALLTGDHLAFSARLNRLTIFRNYNWHSVPQQLDSVEKVIGLDFLHVLPGHGRRTSFGSAEDRDAALQHLLQEEGA